MKFGHTFGRIWPPQEFEGPPVIVRPQVLQVYNRPENYAKPQGKNLWFVPI